MSYVFLILVFGTTGSTVNTITPMPSMEVCERMLDYSNDDLPSPGRITIWGAKGISKPSQGYCKEIIMAGKPEVK